jgi:ribokinase
MSKLLIFGPARTVETLEVPSVATATEGTTYETVLGGEGETLAVATARLGSRAVYCGRVGDDSGGKRLARLLDSAGVDLSCFHVDRAAKTSHLVREVDPAGNERRILFRGADARMTEAEVQSAFSTAPDAVCVAGEIPYAHLGRIGDLAAERGIPLFLLYTPAYGRCEGLPPMEIFMTDEETAESMVGIRPSGTDTCLQATIAMQKCVRAHYYVIRLGDRGAFVYDGTYCYVVNSYIVPETDARGAGVVFFGATVAEYMSPSGDVLAALRYAAAAAALSTTRTGEAIAPPTADEVMNFLERNG